MGILSVSLGFLVNFLNFADKILQRLGIKIYDVNRDYIIRGLPEGAAEELQKPDIKKYADAIFEDDEFMAELNLLGRVFLSNILKDSLKTRLLINETIQQIPDVLKVPIRKPVFIVGHYRTGTTFLNWLLACDSQFRCPARWEQENPCPPGPVENVQKDPRFKNAVKSMGISRLLNGKSFVIHKMGADKPEECVMIQQRSFVNPAFYLTVKNFANLYFDDKAAARHMYEHYKIQLQLLCWGYDRNIRYIAKAPHHQAHLDILADLFPDATFIYTYRPLTEVLPSTKRMHAQFYEPTGIDVNGGKYLSRLNLVQRTFLTRGIKFLDEIEQTNKNVKVYFLSHRDLFSDPMGEVRKLYDFLGMSLTPEVESAMNSCIKNEFNAVSYRKPVFKNNALFSGESVEKDFKEYLDLMSKRADRSYLI